MKVLPILLGGALLVTAGCGSRAGSRSNRPPLTEEEAAYRWPAELVAGNNRFALDLYRELGQKNDKPLCFSPFSISTALAMTYAGARGDTATEMAKALYFTLPAERLHATYGSAIRQAIGLAVAGGYEFQIANCDAP